MQKILLIIHVVYKHLSNTSLIDNESYNWLGTAANEGLNILTITSTHMLFVNLHELIHEICCDKIIMNSVPATINLLLWSVKNGKRPALGGTM